MDNVHAYTKPTEPDPDDKAWDVFLDDYDYEPLPDDGDFWIDRCSDED